MLNLILAVIVDRAAEARQEDLAHMVRMKEQDSQKAKNNLLKLCKDLDTDENGTLTLGELKKGFDNRQEFADSLKVMDIKREQLDALFEVMDGDYSGNVSYTEFVEKLYDMKTKDMRIMLEFINHIVVKMDRNMDLITKAIHEGHSSVLGPAHAVLAPEASSVENSAAHDDRLTAHMFAAYATPLAAPTLSASSKGLVSVSSVDFSNHSASAPLCLSAPVTKCDAADATVLPVKLSLPMSSPVNLQPPSSQPTCISPGLKQPPCVNL